MSALISLRKCRAASVFACVFLGCAGFARSSTSANYAISPDVLDAGGGVSSNGVYRSVDSLEPFVVGASSSVNYQIGHGYIAQLAGIMVDIAGRFIFYNNSAWDTNNPAAEPGDDAAIAVDKFPLTAGTAQFANYTSYSRGINGIMVDLLNLPPGTPTAADFSFNIGNNNTTASWAAGPAPDTIAVRRGAGVGGSDRVTLIWADVNAVKKQWLRVMVKTTAQTGLASPAIFYFGNAIGDSGNSITDARVTTSDQLGARNHPATALNPASISNLYDFNRDKRVTTTDQLLARNNTTTALTELKLITVSDGGGGQSLAHQPALLSESTGFFGASLPGERTTPDFTAGRLPEGIKASTRIAGVCQLIVDRDENGQLRILYVGTPGERCILQSSGAITTPEWVNISEPVVTDAAGVRQWSVSTIPGQAEFFRVLSKVNESQSQSDINHR